MLLRRSKDYFCISRLCDVTQPEGIRSDRPSFEESASDLVSRPGQGVTVPMQVTSPAKLRPQRHITMFTNTKRVFMYWNKRNTDNENDFCSVEIKITTEVKIN